MRNTHFISRVAIYLLSVILFCFGILHFLHPRDMLLFVPDFIPGGIFWVYVVGAAFILVALAFLTNRMVKAAGYLLAALLILFILTVHLPNYLNAGNKEMQRIAFVNILKDGAIACFALHIAAGAYKQHLNMDNSD
jgi:uncharacterized membrane protein